METSCSLVPVLNEDPYVDRRGNGKTFIHQLSVDVYRSLSVTSCVYLYILGNFDGPMYYLGYEETSRPTPTFSLGNFLRAGNEC